MKEKRDSFCHSIFSAQWVSPCRCFSKVSYSSTVRMYPQHCPCSSPSWAAVCSAEKAAAVLVRGAARAPHGAPPFAVPKTAELLTSHAIGQQQPPLLPCSRGFGFLHQVSNETRMCPHRPIVSLDFACFSLWDRARYLARRRDWRSQQGRDWRSQRGRFVAAAVSAVLVGAVRPAAATALPGLVKD